MNKPFKTYVTAKAELVDKGSDQFKAMAATIQEKYGFELKAQIDLQYVRSCLVTSGMNGNDDIFLRDEMWNARHSPVMKPANWQHKDKDIIGVVYSVEARDLDGNVLDLNQEEPPDVPYEYWTEAVVFKLIHRDRANEIEERAAKGTLFVSMEAWFDDYGYGFIKDNEPTKIIARNDQTSFLDTHLRANGGSGKYDNVKIGRALKGITFGGYGFVDVPANKRSVIDSVISNIEPAVSSETNADLDKLIQSLFKEEQEIDMTKTVAQDAGTGDSPVNVDPNAIAKAVADAIEAREAAKAAADAEAKAKAQAAESAKTAAANAEKVVTLDGAVKAAEGKTTAALELVKTRDAALNEVVKALAGATSDTPPEIAAIDAANAQNSGEADFQAKIAWIKNSVASKVAPAMAELTDLKKKLSAAAATLREQEVRDLLKDVLSEAEVATMVTVASKKDDAAYAEWFAEKELFVERIKGAKAPPAKKDEKAADKKEDVKEDCSMAAVINELVKVRKSANADVNSGVQAGPLKNPRFKIAGSEESVEDVLDGAKKEEKIDLTAAKGGNDDEKENGFRTLAAAIVNNDKKANPRPGKAKAGFDPVDNESKGE